MNDRIIKILIPLLLGVWPSSESRFVVEYRPCYIVGVVVIVDTNVTEETAERYPATFGNGDLGWEMADIVCEKFNSADRVLEPSEYQKDLKPIFEKLERYYSCGNHQP